MDVFTPRTLEEALRLKAELPEARWIQGGTDVMVELNFGRARPEALVNLAELAELRGWSREGDELRLGAAVTYTEARARRSLRCCPRSPRRPARSARRRSGTAATIGGNLGTASPAGDALPPLLAERAEVELASVRGARTLPLDEFLLGPKRNALAPDELVVVGASPAERRASRRS